jgi:hypothetical protein
MSTGCSVCQLSGSKFILGVSCRRDPWPYFSLRLLCILKWGFLFNERKGATTVCHSLLLGGDSSGHSLTTDLLLLHTHIHIHKRMQALRKIWRSNLTSYRAVVTIWTTCLKLNNKDILPSELTCGLRFCLRKNCDMIGRPNFVMGFYVFSTSKNRFFKILGRGNSCYKIYNVI